MLGKPSGLGLILICHTLEQDLSDAEIASKARGQVGDDGWPEGWFVWGQDEVGEFIEYYLTSRWGDRHGRIGRDGSHAGLRCSGKWGRSTTSTKRWRANCGERA